MDCFEALPMLGRFAAVITDPPIKVYWQGGRARLAHTTWLEQMRARARTVMFTVSNETANDFPPPHQKVIWEWASETPVFVYGLSADLPDRFHEPWPRQEAYGHGSVKPISLLERLVKSVADGAVLDPFMGTGTTGVAAVRAGREFTGVEIDKNHFHTAQRRIADAA